MSPKRALASGVLAGALVLSVAACSKDSDEPTRTDRPAVSFAEPPEGSTDLGLCYAYELEDMKELIGGDNSFKRKPPEAIGAEGDPVTGETCAWERTEANGDTRSLRIEARDFQDPAVLEQEFGPLRDGTLAVEPVADFGDEAFSSVSDETTLLQIRDGKYLLTLSSRGTGSLEAVSLDELKFLAGQGLGQLP